MGLNRRKPVYRCPCCDQSIPDPIGFRPVVRFGPVQARMFQMLRRAPDGISAADIREALYTGADGGPSRNIVGVMAHHLRPKLAKLGLRLHSTGGPGSVYRLIDEKALDDRHGAVVQNAAAQAVNLGRRS